MAIDKEKKSPYFEETATAIAASKLSSFFNISELTFSSTRITANAPSFPLDNLKSAILILLGYSFILTLLTYPKKTPCTTINNL